MDFAQFYLTENPRILNWLHTRVPHSDVEDVAAEAWSRFARHVKDARDPAHYLYQTVRSCIAEYYRSAAVRVNNPLPLDAVDEPCTGADPVHDTVATNLTLDQTCAVLNGFTPGERRAVALYAAGYTGLDVKTRVRASRARRKLRQQMLGVAL